MENSNPLGSSDLSIVIQKYSPYFREVKKRIVFTLVAFVIATSVGFVFYEDIIRFLINILSLQGINIVFTSPFQFINLSITCGLVTGLVIVLPLIIYQVFHFLKPALKKKEYLLLGRFLPFSILLFVIGFFFGALIMKWQIEIFLTRSVSLGIGNILDISGLLSTVFLTSALMGLGFQFPIILLLLLRFGIIKRHQLTSKRSWIYLCSFFFAILLPPDSIIADFFLSFPLIILFEITLLLDVVMERNRKRREQKVPA